MRASLKWIREFIDLAGAGNLAHRLTMAGIEVEGIEKPGAGNERLVIAEVRNAEPVAGKSLLFCRVFDGAAEQEVICGDTTIRAGERVLYAPPGSFVNSRDIGRRKFGDIESAGMLCSLEDTGLVDKSDAVLRVEAEPGTPFEKLIDLQDEIWELNITPNRADCLSQWGVARELAAIFEREATLPPLELVATGKAEAPSVTLEDADACPRYTARILRGVKIGPSPLAVRMRLERCGVRAINNVVDATNIVLLELGQPLHAFDLRKLAGGRIVVRRAKAGEILRTLDDVERKLTGEDLIIADAERPVALAGVMGGGDSEVSEETVDILLESAWFNPVVVRKGAKRHGMHTEASHRFERGVDPAMVRRASDRCAELILAWAGGEADQAIAEAGPGVPTHGPVTLRLARLERILGIAVSPERAAELLRGLGCAVGEGGAGELSVTPPTWRQDLHIEEDFIEEVVRLYGYDKLPAGAGATPLSHVPASPITPADRVRDLLRDAGFGEVIAYSFTSPQNLASLGLSDHRATPIELDKPLTVEQSVMRTTLAVSLLEAASLNHRRGNTRLRLFDVSRVFLAGDPHAEPVHAGAIAVGEWDASLWGARDRKADFFDLKGIAEELIASFGARARWERSTEPFLHPGMSADVYLGDEKVGWVGVLHPRVLRHFDLPDAVALELNVDKLPVRARKAIEAPSRFPAVMRDVAFLVDRKVPAAGLEAALRSAAPAWLIDVALFDVYESEALGDRRNLAFHLHFQSVTGTLRDEEVDGAVQAMVDACTRKTGAELRA